MLGWYTQRQTNVLGGQPVLVPICLTQIPRGVAWNKSQVSEVKGQWLAACTLAGHCDMRTDQINLPAIVYDFTKRGKVLWTSMNPTLHISRDHKPNYIILVINIGQKDDSGLHGCYTVLLSKCLLTFQQVPVPQLPAVKQVDCSTQKMKALWSFETWGDYQTTHDTNPEDFNLQDVRTSNPSTNQ